MQGETVCPMLGGRPLSEICNYKVVEILQFILYLSTFKIMYTDRVKLTWNILPVYFADTQWSHRLSLPPKDWTLGRLGLFNS